MTKPTSGKVAAKESATPKEKESVDEKNRFGLKVPAGKGVSRIEIEMDLRTEDVQVNITNAEFLRPDLVKEARYAMDRAVRRVRAELAFSKEQRPNLAVKADRTPNTEVKLTPEEIQNREAMRSAQASSEPPERQGNKDKMEVLEDVKAMEQSAVEKLTMRGDEDG